jgi:hypothetical protein
MVTTVRVTRLSGLATWPRKSGRLSLSWPSEKCLRNVAFHDPANSVQFKILWKHTLSQSLFCKPGKALMTRLSGPRGSPESFATRTVNAGSAFHEILVKISGYNDKAQISPLFGM